MPRLRRETAGARTTGGTPAVRLQSARRLRAGADAEFNAVAVAIMAVRQPPIADAMCLIRRVPHIAPAYGVAFDLPKAARDDAGTGERRGAVGKVDGAHRLTGDLACCR